MTTASRIILLSDAFLLATYILQALQIFLFSVPSAGSTVEMLFKVKKDRKHSHNHPSSQILKSKLQVVVMMTATAMVTVIFFLPLVLEFFPRLLAYLWPLIPQPYASFRLTGMVLLTVGNTLSTVAVCTLRRHVTFHEFGETRRLFTGSIYRFIRNPISIGLAAVYAGFFFYLPSVVMGVGFGVFLLNSELRIRMEEIYLERTFGDRYRRYKKITGKYFPKILS